MIILKGGEHNPTEIFETISNQLNASWDGVELYKNTNGEFIHMVSYKFLNDCFINVGEMNIKESLYFKNTERNHQRIVLRIMHSGITAALKGERLSNQNNILLYNTNQDVDLILPKNQQMRWISVSFPVEKFDLIADENDFELKFLFHKKEAWFTYFNLTPDIENIVRTMFEIRDNKTLRRSVFISKIIEIFGLLRVKLDEIKFGITTNKSSKDIEKMVLLKDRILSDYSNSPNIKELALEVNMSESSLQRSFKEVFNLPILQFFNQNRLEEAHRQIKYSTQSITEISYSLGYSHIHHLSSAFKKQFGYSPKLLR